MATWTTETHNHMSLGFETTQVLFQGQSPFQKVDIVDTVTYGRLLLLDDAVMTTEKDEFVYHEMISHVPLLVHPNPKRVLVIGGGDGGTVREIVKHPQVEEVVLCEIDAMVVDSCKQFLPSIACELDNPKVTVKIGDGIAYMAEEAANFDVIIVDSTDPVGPGEGLFTATFYKNVLNALNPDGIMTAQSESPFVCERLVRELYSVYGQIFPKVAMYTGHIPTYPSGFWTWAFCSKQYDPQLPEAHLARAQAITQTCKYYNPALHNASLVLPNFVQAMLPQAVAI